MARVRSPHPSAFFGRSATRVTHESCAVRAKSVKGRRARPRKREAEDAGPSHPHSGINANVHTEPPVGTLSVTTRLAMLPPRPDRTVKYCRPLCVYVMGGALTDEPVLNFHSILPLS